MKRAGPWVWLAGAVLLFLASAALTIRAVAQYVTFSIGGSLWDALAAVGTVGAAVVAIALALRAWLGERDRAARLVSAWVTDEFVADLSASRYIRHVAVHISNEGNEPVFDSAANIVVGTDTHIGPLSVPGIIPVLPPRRELSFDISTPLRFREEQSNARVELRFSDARGRRWLRDGSGILRAISPGARSTLQPANTNPDELGPLDRANPMTLAIAFASGVRNGEDMSHLIAPEVLAGWRSVDWKVLKQDFLARGVSSYVSYPAPRVAWVKFAGGNAAGKSVVGDVHLFIPNVRVLTLTLASDRGWRVYQWGEPIAPDRVTFPDEGLLR